MQASRDYEEKLNTQAIIEAYTKAKAARRFANIFAKASQVGGSELVTLRELYTLEEQMGHPDIRQSFEDKYIKTTDAKKRRAASGLMHLLTGIYYLRTTKDLYFGEPTAREHLCLALTSKNAAISAYALYYLKINEFNQLDYIQNTPLENLNLDRVLALLKEYLKPLVDQQFAPAIYHLAHFNHYMQDKPVDFKKLLTMVFRTTSERFVPDRLEQPPIQSRIQGAAHAGYPPAMAKLAGYYADQNKLDNAMIYHESLAKLGYTESLVHLAELNYRALPADKKAARLLDDSGYPLLQKAIDTDDHPYALLTLGLEALNVKRFGQAALYFRRAQQSRFKEEGYLSYRNEQACEMASDHLLDIPMAEASSKKEKVEIWYNRALLPPLRLSEELAVELETLIKDNQCFIFQYLPKESEAKLRTVLGENLTQKIYQRYADLNPKEKLASCENKPFGDIKATPNLFAKLTAWPAKIGATSRSYARVALKEESNLASAMVDNAQEDAAPSNAPK